MKGDFILVFFTLQPKTKEKKAKKQPAPKSKKDVTKAMSVASIQPEADAASKAEVIN